MCKDEQLTPLTPRFEDTVKSALHLATTEGHAATVTIITHYFKIHILEDAGTSTKLGAGQASAY